VEIVNPGGNDKIVQILQYVEKNKLADFVLIDGALDRLSHSNPGISRNVFLVTGAQVGSGIEQIRRKTISTVRKFEWQEAGDELIHLFPGALLKRKGTIIIRPGKEESLSEKTLLEDAELFGLIDNGDCLYTSGAITNTIARRLLETGKRFTIVIRDGTCFIADFRYLERFKRSGIEVFLLRNVRIVGIAVNSKGIRRSFKPSSLTEALKNKLPRKYIFDIMYTE